MISIALALYAHMAPVNAYLMGRNAEITLARSAAPRSISGDATVLILERHGYKTAVVGKNGFVCIVERGWTGAFDEPEYWNPKIRGADCFNPPAARSVLPLVEMKTELLLGGAPKRIVFAAVKEAYSKRKLPTLETGAMSYMMGKGSYLTDDGDHNGPHLMFYLPYATADPWGADRPGSPVASDSYRCTLPHDPKELQDVPPLRVFTVNVAQWSDGTTAH